MKWRTYYEAPDWKEQEQGYTEKMEEQKPIGNIVYFDLETKNLIDHSMQYEKLGMSVGVTWSTLKGDFSVYTEGMVQDLIEELLQSDFIVGFNHINFDYIVLSAYMNEEQIKRLYKVKSLDMLAHLQSRLGHRVSLDSLVNATLGDEKSSSGVQAVQWYEEGKIDQIIEYCKKDVDVTRRLYNFGCEHGYVSFVDKYTATIRNIGVYWKKKRGAINWIVEYHRLEKGKLSAFESEHDSYEDALEFADNIHVDENEFIFITIYKTEGAD